MSNAFKNHIFVYKIIEQKMWERERERGEAAFIWRGNW